MYVSETGVIQVLHRLGPRVEGKVKAESRETDRRRDRNRHQCFNLKKQQSISCVSVIYVRAKRAQSMLT
jgi:hypothetical protein